MAARTQDIHPRKDPPRNESLAWVIPNATVFVSGGCIMVIELVAGRLIARHLGSSIYTWTSVIGVVLAGIAIGNYIGGRLADRSSSKRTLAVLFMLSAALSALISLMDQAVGGWLWLGRLAWPARVATHVGLVFFLPSAMLGTISPVVAKMALDLGYRTGQTIGSVYAWGVIGSIVGTFMTGFWLIAWFGTSAIVWGVSGVLALMAVLFAVRSWKPWAFSVGLAGLALVANAPWAWARRTSEALYLRVRTPEYVLYVDESQYSYIRITQMDKDRDTRAMHLDTLLHSQIEMAHPMRLFYGYERVCGAVTNRLSRGKPHVDTLTIGGGGYVFPRYLELSYPGSRTDVVEIDPAVTRAAQAAFGLPVDSSIRTFHEDGRVLLDRLVQRKEAGESIGLYDFIYLDVFDDVMVPPQLTTVEFARLVSELLAPEGVYLLNSIDILDQGLFLGSLVATMREVFPYVYVLTEGDPLTVSRKVQNTYIIAGAQQPLDLSELSRDCAPPCRIEVMPDVAIERILLRDGVRVLTDDYAPVEIMLASVVRAGGRKRAIEELADRHHERAMELCQAGKLEQAAVQLREALRIRPDSAAAMFDLGTVYYRQNQVDEALATYRQTTKIDPGKVNAWYMLGNCHALKADFAAAKRYYSRALELVPEHADALDALRKVSAAELQRNGG